MICPCVYILANRKHGTLYTGSTSDIRRRFEQHNAGVPGSFTQKYNIKMLVYLEFHAQLDDARNRERQIKAWQRAWKIQMIEKQNPDWRNLAAELPF